MIKIENRASTVLYNFLINNCLNYFFLLPANICPIVPLIFLKARINFRFIDIDLHTQSGSWIEYRKVLKKIRGGKIGLLYVNGYGAINDCSSFYKEIKSIYHDVIIIEDNCLCIPETERSLPKDYVDLELYSTGYSKYVSLPIGGGYGLLNDHYCYEETKGFYSIADEKEQLERLRTCRINTIPFTYIDNSWLNFEKLELGKNGNENHYLDMVRQAKDQAASHKLQINKIYDDYLMDKLKMGSQFNNWRYLIWVTSRKIQQEILNTLQANNLFASTHYASAGIIFKQQTCINAETSANHIINLFNNHQYNIDKALTTAKIINQIVSKY